MSTLAILALALSPLAPPPPPAQVKSPPAAEVEHFERRVRPLLLEHCVQCHGPKKEMGGLRLDSAAALDKGGDNGPALVRGDPERSRLIQAVRHQGDLKMPPRKRIPAEGVEALARWVKAGAPWPAEAVRASPEAWKSHWAFQRVRRPAIPPALPGWGRTPVDAFIQARQGAQGLTPSPEADRVTLLRRLSFDLTGLPPTPDEVAAFVPDASPGAYERLVDRLLASPRYGERWARHWLDVARFSDTKGYVFFEEASYPWAWTYRDYVIRAFNHDLPYDRFLTEQLAADRLDLGADAGPLAALGFLTLGGRFMNNVHDVLDDQIDVVTRGLMGLTVGCARCHDHKFDPVPAADYYALYGVFASSVEPEVPPLFAAPPATPEYQKFTAELARRERALAEFVKAKEGEVFEGARRRVAEYLLAAHARRGQPSADEFMLIADGADINPAMLKRWQAYLERPSRRSDPVWAPWHAFADLPEASWDKAAAPLLVQLRAGKVGAARVNPLVARALVEKAPRKMAEVADAYRQALLDTEQLRQEDRKRGEARAWGEDREALRRVFHGPDAPPDVPPGQVSSLELLPDRPAQAKYQELRKAVETFRATGPGAPPRAHALVDRPVPFEPRVFRRGNPAQPGDAVPRRFLTSLSTPSAAPFSQGSGRLELARAIASPDNPLTARVIVNRLWMHHFGEGLVRTPGDFGLRSEPPTHPDLLDWLADELVRSGWSLKHLQRLIVTSAVYRQASVDRPAERAKDPENRLLWKMPRRRLDFESTRDALVSVAGRLTASVGGPSVGDVLSPSSPHRTLLGRVDRLQVPGLYRTFDYPSPDASSPRRDSTTVPQQALFLMNSPFVQAAARGLLDRPEVAREVEVARRIDALYRVCYGRTPSPEEAWLAREFLTPPTPAGWQRFAQALLLSNEFAFAE